MRLSDFILNNLEIILQEWEEFAATLCPEDVVMDKAALRDHAKLMLVAIASDLRKHQTDEEEAEKSQGRKIPASNKETAATAHGKERLALGFSLLAAMAEYRALRASVTRLWQKALGNDISGSIVGDLIRFNEAMDQSINESVASYSFEREQETRIFDTILSSSPDPSFTFTLDGKFAYINKAMVKLLELPADEVIGKNYLELGFLNAIDLQYHIDQVVKFKKQSRTEMAYTSPSGQHGYYDYIFVPALDKKGNIEAVAGTARNITARKAMEDENWRRANYDLLTGLPNRRLFLDRIERDVKHTRRVGARIALLFIDLDQFKEANDKLGHDAGDLILRIASKRISECVRESDTVARLGGDEFTVILQGQTDAKHAEFIAGKILTALADPFQVFYDTIHISASIGIALAPNDGLNSSQLLKNADQAMYMAKNAGRNKFCFYSANQEQPAAARPRHDEKRS